ncbi:hypothetical protein [Pandoraea sputorum]|uniref:hypothetical protein n=1 Tax=Pandoraea sputorum TaxID=93222 RepID=UPI0030C6A2E9
MDSQAETCAQQRPRDFPASETMRKSRFLTLRHAPADAQQIIRLADDAAILDEFVESAGRHQNLLTDT